MERSEEFAAADYRQGITLGGATGRVLLIAPNSPQSGSLSSALTAAGYQVTIATSAETGIEVASAQHPDVILLSQQMSQPGKAVELRSRLDALTDLANVPLLILEENSDAEPAKGGRGNHVTTLPGHPELLKRLSELEEVNEKLREQERLKAGFISMVVHDIRSPLTVIMGTLDLMCEDLVTGRPLDHQHYQRLFTESLRNCQEIDHLIEDMLDLARMREHRLRLNFEQSSCSDLLEQALATASGAARHAGITLDSEIQPLLPQIYTDRKQMHRALMNLVNNAIKFTPRGGRVTLRARLLEERRRDAPCDYVLLSVVDTGEGLAPEEAPYIFDAYWQAPNGRRKPGTGLGLAIVKRIAVAHGGNVSVRSAPGKGSAFTIMIPVRERAPDQAIELKE